MAEDRKRAGFMHLRVKSAYSLLEGAIRAQELAGLARDAGMPAVAVTDVNNLFGTYELSDTLAKAGVQPIVGCLLSVELEDAAPANALATRRKPPGLPLLVQNDIGYRNLTKLLSAAYLVAEPGDWPHVKPGLIAAHSPDRRGSAGRRGRDARQAGADLPGPPLCRAAASRPRRGARGRGQADRSRLCQVAAACRHQRRPFRSRRHVRGA